MSLDEKEWLNRQSGNITLRPNDHRDVFQRDRARILHSAAFRRLQSKTQILGVGQNDFYRTRLTHSLEVAQIGTGLTAQLKQSKAVQKSPLLQQIIPNDALIESLCLAHDLGHPPFGHGGEIALNYKMREHGGFEANGQTFRIISKLEPYTPNVGMDLTRRTILGLIKYPGFIESQTSSKSNTQNTLNHEPMKASDWKPVKGLFLDDKDSFFWAISHTTEEDRSLFIERKLNAQKRSNKNFHFTDDKSIHKTFDCSIMEIADDIAYGVHDLEDAIVLNRVNRDTWNEMVLPVLLEIDNPWSKVHANQLSDMLFSVEHYERKNAIGALVNHLITNIEVYKQNAEFQHPLFRYNARLNKHAEPILSVLKKYVFRYVIQACDIQQLEYRGQRMLMMLFDTLVSDPERLLPEPIKVEWRKIEEQNGEAARVVCDYLASMSDEQAQRTYCDLFGVQQF